MKHLSLYIIGILVLLLSACSTKKNTAGSRFWHSFNARYNTYFNGSEAYKEGFRLQEEGNRDNYTDLLPVFPVGNEKTRQLGTSNYETAITKCEKAIQLHSIKRRPTVSANKKRTAKLKAYLSRKEFNPFLKHAWLLMGKAQFGKGEFLEAASTFSYITRLYAAEPVVAAEARSWLARCYAELDWFYDAEDALARLNRDTVPPRLRRERDATMADLLLRQNRYEEALPYLRRTAGKAHGKLQKARLHFLLGQVEQQLGHREAAYKALAKCIRLSPPYELAFNARILQTEVLSDGDRSKKMIARLRRMARSDNNKEYLDQVYYAMGNIYMSLKDTAHAIGAYEKGREKSTRNGIEKGVLLLRLGEIYWDSGRYAEAQKCYGEAIGLIEKDHDNYEEITRRSKVLDELVPYTSAIHLQDSLQELSRMSEKDRNAAIDRVIEMLRKKEEEERRARADSAAEARAQENGGNVNARPGQSNSSTAQNKGSDTWYFYNPMLVAQGKQDFQKQWGKRKNEDNWRRSNRSVLAIEDHEGYDYEAEDSLRAAEAAADSLAEAEAGKELPDSAQNDPHHREYYLKQIPFTPEALQASDAIIKDGLYNAGLIEKDKLEDFPLAARTLLRLHRQYPDFEKMEDVYYQLFLLYSRQGRAAEAEEFRRLLAEQYPGSAVTRFITSPDYELNARFGKQLEDSLYAATYQAYRLRDNATVARNFAVSTEKYPTGANRPKFIFVHALSRLGTADSKELAAELRSLVQEFPESDVSEMAGMIVKGLESGRTIGQGTFDIGSLWSRRTAEADTAAAAAGKERQLSADRDVPFLFLVAYPTDSVSDDSLLYELARFNFTGFMVRNFDISIQREPGLTQFRVRGFNSFDEAHTYAQKIFTDVTLAAMLRRTRVVLISEHNADLLGSLYSFDDYKAFYEKTFAPLKINPDLPLDMEDGPVEQHYEDEYSPEELDRLQDGGNAEDTGEDDGEWYSE